LPAGTLSAALAAFSLYLRASWVPMLVSYAIGALLGAAFLEIIPHAVEKGDRAPRPWRSSAASSASSCWRSCCCGATAIPSIAKIHDQHAQPHDHGRTAC